MTSWLVLLLCISAVSALPGIRLALTEEGLNKALFRFYSEHISTSPVSLGDYSTVLQWVGTEIDIQLHDVTLTSVTMDYSKSLVKFHSPSEFTYSIHDLSVEAKAECGVMLGLIKVSPGEATLGVKNARATIIAEFMTVRGKPHIDIIDVDFDIGSVYLQTQLPKEYNDIINKQLTAQLVSWQKLLPYLAFKSGPDINAYLKDLDFQVACPVESLAVDLGFVLGPDVEEDKYLVLGLNGTVIADGVAVNAGTPNEESEILSGKLKRHLNGEVSDSVGNSLLKSFWKRLDYSLSELPSEERKPITTETLAMVIPQLIAKWGNELMLLHFHTSESDYIDYASAGTIHANASVTIDFLVQKELEWVNALVLDIAMTSEVALAVVNDVANANVKSFRVVKVTQVMSQSGDVNTAMLTPLLTAVGTKAIEEVNKMMKDVEIDLPPHFKAIVQKDSLKVKNGFVAVGADF